MAVHKTTVANKIMFKDCRNRFAITIFKEEKIALK